MTDLEIEQTAGPLFVRFAAMAAQYGGEIAASAGSLTLTYSELHQRAEDYAVRLRRAGVSQGHLVAVNHSGIDYLTAILGVLAVGAVYLPLDERDSSSRSSDLLDHARANYLVGPLRDVERLAPTPIFPPGPAGPGFPAYVMYTSGSAGRPKGVVIPHRAVMRLAADPGWISLGPQTRTYAMAPFAFDASTLELWASLLNGGAIVFPSQSTISLLSMATDIARSEVRELWVPSGIFTVLVERHVDALRGLRHLITGGDVVSVPHAERAAYVLDNCVVMNGYGPTENTTFSTTYRIPRGEKCGASVPIGTPIDGTVVRTLGDDLAPVESGEPGQLALAGAGLALGYLHDPELTSLSFVPDSTGDPTQLLYLTGDLVRDRGDGNLLFIGRKDSQVKVRGHRVEPAEVEMTLLRHRCVTRAVVVPSSMDERKHLIAYVVPDGPFDRAELERFLQQQLPDYMIPNEIFDIPTIPLTRHGKIDRERLATLATENAAARDTVTPPANELERRLIYVFERILAVHPVGADDSFFQLGGDSLAGLELLETLDMLLSVDIDSGQLLTRDTPRSLAALINGAPRRFSSPLVPLKPDGHRSPFFCVHGGGGEVLFLSDIRRYLSHEQPFYGVSPPGLNADGGTPTRVEEFARRYADAIIAEHDLGPYSLGGLCFGGNIAVETARRLLNAGADVQAVVLFDTVFPTPYRIAREILHHRLRQFLRASRGAKPTVGGLRLLWTSGRGGAVERNILRAVLKYTPSPYPGRIAAFLGLQAKYSASADPRLSWAAVARGGIDIRHLPGTRSSMFSGENARVLASELEAYLALTERTPRYDRRGS